MYFRVVAWNLVVVGHVREQCVVLAALIESGVHPQDDSLVEIEHDPRSVHEIEVSDHSILAVLNGLEAGVIVVDEFNVEKLSYSTMEPSLETSLPMELNVVIDATRSRSYLALAIIVTTLIMLIDAPLSSWPLSLARLSGAALGFADARSWTCLNFLAATCLCSSRSTVLYAAGSTVSDCITCLYLVFLACRGTFAGACRVAQRTR